MKGAHGNHFLFDQPKRRDHALNMRTAQSELGMERIAQATGGAFVPKSDNELNDIFAGWLRTSLQYLLQYSNNESARALPHRRHQCQGQLHVRAREGYFPKAK